MTDVPRFVDGDAGPVRTPNIVRARKTMTRAAPRLGENSFAGGRYRLLALVDVYMAIVVAALLAIGMMMVFSTTFDLSFVTRGSESAIFLQHVRNAIIGLVLLIAVAAVDYRVWRRFAVWALLFTIGSLIGVLLFGDDTFGARRALINGSYQPGELAELAMVLYMATWLGSKRTKIRSVVFGLLPFMILLSIIGLLIMLQPDLSTAAVIFIVSGTMYFLAGASLVHLAGVIGVGVGASTLLVLTQPFSYAQTRVATYISSVNDLSEANYQIQQAVIAFRNGGWTGVGLGQGLQKFGALPAPHTDSIFAVIGEELGIIGAGVVVLLYIAFVIRGFQITRRAVDPFGALLGAGVTIWVATQAMLNIAVMASVVPPTGVPLPFISFGGSSLVVLMIGVGLLLSISRVSAQANASERRKVNANYDRGGRNGGPRLSRSGRGGGAG